MNIIVKKALNITEKIGKVSTSYSAVGFYSPKVPNCLKDNKKKK